MTRAFTPRDAGRLRALEARGTPLEIEDSVLVGLSPLRQALASWLGIDERRSLTWVLPSGPACPEGFVQACRAGRQAPEARLTYIAPAIAAVDGAAHAWSRLVAGACQGLGALGVERVLAAVGEDDSVALQVLRKLGFAVLTYDVVFSLPTDAVLPDPPADIGTVPMRPDFEHALRTWRRAALPESVRRALPSWDSDWPGTPACGRAPGPVDYRACLDERGELVGAWHVVGGRRGHWLQVCALGDPEPLVRSALATLARDGRFPPRPRFAVARGYEPDYNRALRDTGFAPSARRFRLVKHTAARVIAPAWREGAVTGNGLRRAPSSPAPAPAGPARAGGAARAGAWRPRGGRADRPGAGIHTTGDASS